MPRPTGHRVSSAGARRDIARDANPSDLVAAAAAAGVDVSTLEKRPYNAHRKDKRPSKHSKPATSSSASSSSTRTTAATPSASKAPSAADEALGALEAMAAQHWSLTSTSKFKPALVNAIYTDHIKVSNFSARVTTQLEFSHYLERYLWPHYTPTSSTEHTMSVVLMVVQKFKESIPAWPIFASSPDAFAALFVNAVRLLSALDSPVSMQEHVFLVHFFTHAFNSLETDAVRANVQHLVSLPIWTHISEGRRADEFAHAPKLQKTWNGIQKRLGKLDKAARATRDLQMGFLHALCARFFNTLAALDSALESGTIASRDGVHQLRFVERFLELAIDLVAQTPTRRYVNTLFDAEHLVLRCRLSLLVSSPSGTLFAQLLMILKFYVGFEIDDITGEALSDAVMTQRHYDAMRRLQRLCFRDADPKLRAFSLASVASVDTRAHLLEQLEHVDDTKLRTLARALHLDDDPDESLSRAFLLELFIERYERRLSQTEAINQMPLYPTETMLWDENLPSDFYAGERCLALPKLHLQFLTLQDYLLRNLNLFRLESTYEIRGDIEDAVQRLQPRVDDAGETLFQGWARMAAPIARFTVAQVRKPNLGESRPASVLVDVTLDMNLLRAQSRLEWLKLRKHDVLFLVTVRATQRLGGGPVPGQASDAAGTFMEQTGVTYVRGCEVLGLLDDDGNIVEEKPFSEPPRRSGSELAIRCWLDASQYEMDVQASAMDDAEDVHETFNVVVRRQPKENNFKAVLDTIRSLMNSRSVVVPDWLHDVFLGYGDPADVHYASDALRPRRVPALNFNDTFLDIDHLRESFPNADVVLRSASDTAVAPPFHVAFSADGPKEETLTVSHVPLVNRGPYPRNQVRRNQVRFTPTQIEAVRAAMHPGLSVVVGPPGTGKTDVAVQIISNWYHNFPNQRILLVTHSNQALNQLFEKIMALDVDERHLLRLGRGEEELDTDKNFGKFGRVSYVLERRLQLLAEVRRLAESLQVKGDLEFTCESAAYFRLQHIVSAWEKFLATMHAGTSSVAEAFPFAAFFSDAPQPLFAPDATAETDLETARGCYRYLEKIFDELKEFRAFELLRTSYDRTNYLLVKEARIVAMTCTHAALKRADLVELGFQYDNLLMEEAAQILEIETFIPMVLQEPAEGGESRLKRVVMIGDHHQLPPVIKNTAFQKYSNMEQSMFTRFVRLGVRTVDLDAQGRARASIAALYSWRYASLGNLPHVQQRPEFLHANPGFVHDYQFVDVPDFQGRGESTPQAYFYQNLAEAEYIVAVFMYMRLLGYPAERITMLTTYNGQKSLLYDIVNARCRPDPLIGMPAAISTVDKYQGSQNDFVLLSLVRTSAVGHVRDVRRLVVALSRARLGLYVFGRASLFNGCHELQPALSRLLERPTQLELVPTESFGTPVDGRRPVGTRPDASSVVSVADMPTMCNVLVPGARQKHTARPPPPGLIPVSARPTDVDADDEAEAGAPIPDDLVEVDDDDEQGSSEFAVTLHPEDKSGSRKRKEPEEVTTSSTAESVASTAQEPSTTADASEEPSAKRQRQDAEDSVSVPMETSDEAPVSPKKTKKSPLKKKTEKKTEKPESSEKAEKTAEEEDEAKEAASSTNAAPILSDKEIGAMTVAKLRVALEERGLSTKGLKAELVARLKDAQ